MVSLTDPERLRDRDGVRFLEESRIVPQSEFESVVETVDSHVAVGITNDDGAVLLENDGSHGWTLPAFVVDAGEDWAETARHGIGRLTDGPAELEAPELAVASGSVRTGRTEKNRNLASGCTTSSFARWQPIRNP